MSPTEQVSASSSHVKAWLTLIVEPDQRFNTLKSISLLLQAASRTPNESGAEDLDAINWLLMIQYWLLRQDGLERGMR